MIIIVNGRYIWLYYFVKLSIVSPPWTPQSHRLHQPQSGVFSYVQQLLQLLQRQYIFCIIKHYNTLLFGLINPMFDRKANLHRCILYRCEEVIRWRNKRTDARSDSRSQHTGYIRNNRLSDRASKGREAQSASAENRRCRTWNETPRQHGLPAEEVSLFRFILHPIFTAEHSPITVMKIHGDGAFVLVTNRTTEPDRR